MKETGFRHKDPLQPLARSVCNDSTQTQELATSACRYPFMRALEDPRTMQKDLQDLCAHVFQRSAHGSPFWTGVTAFEIIFLHCAVLVTDSTCIHAQSRICWRLDLWNCCVQPASGSQSMASHCRTVGWLTSILVYKPLFTKTS